MANKHRYGEQRPRAGQTCWVWTKGARKAKLARLKRHRSRGFCWLFIEETYDFNRCESMPAQPDDVWQYVDWLPPMAQSLWE